MPKIFDQQFIGSYTPKRLNENKWFEQYQDSLLWLANTDLGRDLLCIEKSFPFITRIGKNFVQAEIEAGKYITDFRIGAKWANVIRFRWNEFCNYMTYAPGIQYTLALDKVPVLSSGLRGTTTTVYPDPDPESTTVDGRCLITTERTWASQRAQATSDSALDSEASGNLSLLRSPASGDINRFQRALFGFDTSAVGGDTVSSATLSYYVTATADTFVTTMTAAQSESEVVSSSPASNTALATGDFDSLGSTSFGALTTSTITTSAYNDVTLNASGQSHINGAGVTNFGALMGSDLDNDEPTTDTSSENFEVTIYYADQAGTTNDPKLVVEHAAGGASFTPRAIFF